MINKKQCPDLVRIDVDKNIFDIDNILKASYEFVDKVYMSFKTDWDKVIVEFKKKDKKVNLDEISDSFWEELVFHRLRKQIDNSSSQIRYKILETALWFWVNLESIKEDIKVIWQKLWVVVDTTWTSLLEQSSEDNKLDVGDIISEISNDPEFAEDKDDIIAILKEIEMDNK